MAEENSNIVTMEKGICPHHRCSLKFTTISSKCEVCHEDHNNHKQGYKCNLCNFYVHEECIILNISSHHKHSLELSCYWLERIDCCLCETNLRYLVHYQCPMCSFFLCVSCAKNPLFSAKTKAHEHELHQIPMKLSFTCDACGLYTKYSPCICFQCSFIIHKECILLPRVICINLHGHRISHVSSLGPGKWICGVCRDLVNGGCGAYSCLVCPNYVVHSRCAINFVIWDGRELEGVPDQEDENKPFKVIYQNVIKHFSHEHNLVYLHVDVLPRKEDKYCYACTLTFDSKWCYKCTQCDFILHEACANLPRKIRHLSSTQPLTLHGDNVNNYFCCDVCKRYCTGFSYNDNDNIKIDMQCASIFDTIKHESHPHWLFVHWSARGLTCNGCSHFVHYFLGCNDGYCICFRCTTLPISVRHKCDDHPLFLCYGETNVNATYCCGICEEKISSEVYFINRETCNWFYRCNDCVSTFHTLCVFGNLLHSRPGYNLVIEGKGIFDLIPNNHLSRPICCFCKKRCMDDLVLISCCFCAFP